MNRKNLFEQTKKEILENCNFNLYKPGMIVNGKEVVWSEAVEELLVKDEAFCEEVTCMLRKFKNGNYEYSGCAFDKHQYKQYNLNHPNRPIGSYYSTLYNEEVQIRQKVDHIVIYFPFEN